MRKVAKDFLNIQRAARRAGTNGSLELSVAYYRAPTLAANLAGIVSVDLLGDLSQQILESHAAPRPVPFELRVIQRFDNKYGMADRWGWIAGLLVAGIIGLWYSFPYGAVFAILLLPGPVFAMAAPFVLRWWLRKFTRQGRRVFAMAYGVHLKAQADVATWQSLTWQQFERSVADLLRRLGYQARHTGGAGDKGIDIIASSPEHSLAVQCKKHRQPVGPAPVRELLGAAAAHPGHVAVLVSAGGFSPAAMEAASTSGILLLDALDLVRIQQNGSLGGYLAPAHH